MDRMQLLIGCVRKAALAILASVVCFEIASGQNCSLPGILALIRGEFPDKPALVAMYNRYLTSDGSTNPACDIGVSFPGRSALTWVNQLQGIESPGGKQTSYFSIADIQSNIATDRSLGVEWIFYDLEGGLSPDSDISDPINSINQAAAIVHNAGLKFAFTVVNVGRHPRDIVPHVVANADAYNPQGQSFIQQGCSVYANEVGQVMSLAKQHNPSLRLWAQLSLLRGTVETNEQCLTQLIDYLAQRGYRLDAVTVFYGLDSNHVALLDQFYQWYTQQYRPSCDNTGAIFRIERATGNVCADGSFNAGGADVAEYILTSEPVEPGDVVELDPHNPKHYRKARGAYSPVVAGVVSTRPGFVLGLKLRPNPFSPSLKGRGISPLALGEGVGERFAPLLALLGRVSVKATTENGPIRPGDLLTSSSKPGYAMRCESAQKCEGAIIGKALELLVEGEGIILILLAR